MTTVVVCANCGWTGEREFYDIGDGPEWCCPECDLCWPSRPVFGPDGLTVAERQMLEWAEEVRRSRYPLVEGEREGMEGNDVR